MSGLSTTISEINKKFGSSVLNFGIKEDLTSTKNKIKFSSPRLNYMLYGGIPRGRLIEFAGEENSGKTTTALDLVSNAQEQFEKEYEEAIEYLESLDKPTKQQQQQLQFLRARGPLKCLFVDCENTLDEEWARILNVNLDDLLILKPENQTAEEIFDAIEELCKTEGIGFVVLDSLGVMVSQNAYEESYEKRQYGGISIPLTAFTKKCVQLFKRLNITFIGINQLRDKINSPMGGKDTTGGRAWKHNCSVRLFFSKGDYFDEAGKSLTRSAESPAGNKVMVNIQKTKVCRPDRRVGYYTLHYTYGIDWIADLVDVAEKFGFINKNGAWFYFLDPETGELMLGVDGNPLKLQGKPAVINFLEEDENLEILQELEDKINAKICT